MDSDCLIKLTTAGGKEPVCRAFSVVIPAGVKREVVDEGGDRPDALVVARNIQAGRLAVAGSGESCGDKGEDGALDLYKEGGFDGICSDDRRFVAKLRTLGIPYLTPAALIVVLGQTEHIDEAPAIRKLLRLGLETYVANLYGAGRLTLREAAQRLGLCLGDTIELLRERGVSGNLTATDVLESIERFA